LIALYPQFHLQITRGKDWNGSYAFFSQDEIAYSAYVNALTQGRPRRNDPYTGRDDAPGMSQPESLFSIQFVPAYSIAIPARLFGLSAPTTFIVLTIVIAFASALALFWLLAMLTGDEALAAAGSAVILCLGTYALLYAPLRMLVGLDTTYTYEYFPFLRRYVPAMAFPLCFVFFALVWRALTNARKRPSFTASLLAGVSFSLLVFSYFYLWTAAAAWLACIAALWLVARSTDRKTTLKALAPIALIGAAALAGYFMLLAKRAPTMDTVQLLAISRAPDFSRSSIKLGLIVCVVLALAAWRKRIEWRSPAALFAASFALMPLAVFNQQIITGRSLQPLHYELYIAKYLALLALVITAYLIWQTREQTKKRVRGRIILGVAAIAVGWGMIETSITTGRHAWASVDRDEMALVARRLLENSRAAGEAEKQAVVLYFNLDHADLSPVIAPQPVLWAPHTPAFSGVTTEENRERLYQYLYYTSEDITNVDERGFEALDYRKKFLIRSLIEWGHTDPAWTVDWKPITPEEIRAALQGYTEYAASFSREDAQRPTLSYVVIDGAADLTNLARWYQRDAGERIGRFTLYRVRLR
jgi:hypothetical protein